jgi:hypothetical protein
MLLVEGEDFVLLLCCFLYCSKNFCLEWRCSRADEMARAAVKVCIMNGAHTMSLNDQIVIPRLFPPR